MRFSYLGIIRNVLASLSLKDTTVGSFRPSRPLKVELRGKGTLITVPNQFKYDILRNFIGNIILENEKKMETPGAREQET